MVRITQAPWRTAAKAFFLAALTMTVIMNGSVAEPYTSIALLFLSVPALLVLILPDLIGRRARTMVHVGVLTCFVLAVGFAQVVPVPMHLAHPAWNMLPADIRPNHGFISVNPEHSLEALARTALPALAFLTALGISNSDRDAQRLWNSLAALGLAVLMLSAGLELLFPDVHVFASRPVGGAPFNGVFVNRNTMAAFLVVVLFAVMGSVVLRSSKTDKNREKRLLALSMWWAVLLLTAIAIVATASRAGAFFGLICLALSGGGVLAMRLSERAILNRRLRLFFVVGACLIFLLLFYAAFGNPVLARLDSINEITRQCLWRLTFEAWREQPILGAGIGTFADVFPAYRTPACPTGGPGSIVLHAHNSFLDWSLGLGWLGPLVVGLFYLEIVRLCRVGLVNRRRLRGIPILLAGLTLYLTLHSMVDFPLQIPGMAAYAAALFGAGAAICVHNPARDRPRSSRSRRRSKKSS